MSYDPRRHGKVMDPNDGLAEDGDSYDDPYDDPHDAPLYLGGEGADGGAETDDVGGDADADADDAACVCDMA